MCVPYNHLSGLLTVQIKAIVSACCEINYVNYTTKEDQNFEGGKDVQNQKEGETFINDSLSLSPSSTSETLRSFPVILIPFISTDHEIELLKPIIETTIKDHELLCSSHSENKHQFEIGAIISTPSKYILINLSNLIDYLLICLYEL